MLCPYCSKEIPNDASTCPFCGQSVQTEADIEAMKAEKSNKALSTMLWGIGGIAVTWQVNMILGVIFSIIALVKAHRFKETYGTPSSLVCVGKNLSIIAIIVSAVTYVTSLLTLASILVLYVGIFVFYMLFAIIAGIGMAF